jgi:hypothetical protein
MQFDTSQLFIILPSNFQTKTIEIIFYNVPKSFKKLFFTQIKNICVKLNYRNYKI